jgi:glycolate oxidase iron-sulfur subunit
MQTTIAPRLLKHPDIDEAKDILQACVHCGFCTATCPTYQLLGSELDSPRGRIYLIKEMLEKDQATEKTRLHLDRCLTCLSCETTCPSGVRYGRLIDIGREIVEEHAPRSLGAGLLRKAMLAFIPYTKRMSVLLALGRLASPFLPQELRKKIPEKKAKVSEPTSTSFHARRMLVLEGCVQPLGSPNTNAAAMRVLDRMGITLVSVAGAGCCGALHQHLADGAGARAMIRRNIDAWWPQVESGAEAVVITASGCGVMAKDYGDLLKHDQLYAEKAARISALTFDLSEIIHREGLEKLANIGKGKRVACQSPCSFQHGQKLGGVVENILKNCGFTLTPVADSHLCCGAAGTYTLLQPDLSQQLLNNKLAALNQGSPEVIVTSNIGCQMHLAGDTSVPVMHWIELLDQAQTS